MKCRFTHHKYTKYFGSLSIPDEPSSMEVTLTEKINPHILGSFLISLSVPHSCPLAFVLPHNSQYCNSPVSLLLHIIFRKGIFLNKKSHIYYAWQFVQHIITRHLQLTWILVPANKANICATLSSFLVDGLARTLIYLMVDIPTPRITLFVCCFHWYAKTIKGDMSSELRNVTNMTNIFV